jgi:hypothetical protein
MTEFLVVLISYILLSFLLVLIIAYFFLFALPAILLVYRFFKYFSTPLILNFLLSLPLLFTLSSLI